MARFVKVKDIEEGEGERHIVYLHWHTGWVWCMVVSDEDQREEDHLAKRGVATRVISWRAPVFDQASFLVRE